jgi:membrane-associated phospholipid phosphatase
LNHSSPFNNTAKSRNKLIVWAIHHRPVIWLAIIISGLVIFFTIVPVPVQNYFWLELWTHRTLTIMLLAFNLVALSMVWSTGQKIDTWAFLYINLWGKRPAWLDWLMLGFTQFGNGITPIVLALVIFLSGDHLLAYKLIFGTLTLWMVVELAKALVGRSRPFIHLAQTRVVGYRPMGRSFPSGHTSQVFFLAMMMVRHFQSAAWIVFSLYAIALLVGITRMYVGAHYPRDVLAGAILGSVWGILVGLIDGY